jgi:hypothetical protein
LDAYGETHLRGNIYLRCFTATNTLRYFDDLDGCIIYSILPNDWSIELDDKYTSPITSDAIYLPKGRKHKLISGIRNLFLYVIKGHY